MTGRNYPLLVESCKTLSLKRLREWGYLEPNRIKSGGIIFTSRGKESGSMQILSSTFEGKEYIRLMYYFANTGEEFDYKVPLVRVPSNLGKGFRYYFLCPVTSRRCMKLYRPPMKDLFLHREAYPSLIYDKQVASKKMRVWEKLVIGLVKKEDELFKEILNRPKYAKHYYRGIPTPKMRRYLKVRDELRRYSREDFERVVYG